MRSSDVLPGLGAAQRLRFRFWFRAEQELHELTRDRGHEERICSETAVRLGPGAWHLGAIVLRQQEPHVPHDEVSAA